MPAPWPDRQVIYLHSWPRLSWLWLPGDRCGLAKRDQRLLTPVGHGHNYGCAAGQWKAGQDDQPGAVWRPARFAKAHLAQYWAILLEHTLIGAVGVLTISQPITSPLAETRPQA
jgi:hypothetical protein